MKWMNSTTYAVAGSLILAIVLVLGTVAVMQVRSHAIENDTLAAPSTLPPPPELQAPRPYVADDGVNELPITETFENGTHTFTGAIDKPGTCFEIVSDAQLVGENTIALSFDMADKTGQCDFVITPEEFSVSVLAPEGAEVQAKFNGAPLRLVPIDE